MPRKYVKRTRRPRKATRRPRKRTGAGYVTKRQVARMIGRRIEDKYTYQTLSNVSISNTLAAAPHLQQLNFGMSQGTGQGDRLGNRITVKNAVLKGSINLADYSSLFNSKQLDQLVTIVVYKVRNYVAGTNPTYSTLFNRFFQTGDTAATFTNTPIDHIRRYNKDLIMVKAVRHFKIGAATQISGVTGSGTGAGPFPNNDFKYQQFFKIPLTKYYKKTQIFDDSAGSGDAKNDNLFFSVYCCPADGGAFTSSPLTLTWDLEQTFEDA